MCKMINLSIKGKTFTVPKQILEKMGLFRELLEIKDNDLEIDNVDPFFFKILIFQLTNKVDFKRELASLCDFVNLEGRLSMIEECYCMFKYCNNIAFDMDYCELHRCKFQGCKNYEYRNKYCSKHECNTYNCHEFNKNHEICNYCDMHKCYIPNCTRESVHKGYCAFHVAISYECTKCYYTEDYKKFYCCNDNHACNMWNCSYPQKPDSPYCFNDACKFKDCKKFINIYYGNMYCSEHSS